MNELINHPQLSHKLCPRPLNPKPIHTQPLNPKPIHTQPLIPKPIHNGHLSSRPCSCWWDRAASSLTLCWSSLLLALHSLLLLLLPSAAPNVTIQDWKLAS
jgi:hypothetical protein